MTNFNLSENDLRKKNEEDRKDIVSKALEELKEVIEENSIYTPPKESIQKLKDLNYRWDNEGLYCPLWDKDNVIDGMNYYLRISRDISDYNYSIGHFEKNKYKFDTQKFNGKKSITSEHGDRNKKLGQWCIGKIKFKDQLEKRTLELVNIENYEQITCDFNVYKKIESELKIEKSEKDNQMMFEDYPADIQNEARESVESCKLYNNLKKTFSFTHANDENQIEILILIGGSQYIGQPTQSYIDGDTGIGKTDLTENVFNNFPKDHITRLRTFSAKYIYYARDEFNEDYNLLIIDDVDLSNKQNIETLKELTDNKKKVKELKTVIDQKAVTFTLTGKFLVVMTFAKANPDAELLNRMFNTGIIRDDENKSVVKSKIKSNSLIDSDNNKNH